MSLDKTEIANIGKGLNFYNIFSGVTGGTNNNYGIERIKQSIEMIFSIIGEEVPVLPVLGSDLPRKLFEPNDFILSESIEVSLSEAISYLEPRVRVTKIKVDSDDSFVYIKIEGVLRNSNITFNFDYDITRGDQADKAVSWGR